MGSELYAYFPVRSGGGQQAGLAELARELEQEGVRTETDESQVVARLDPASMVRENGEAQLWLDIRRIHLFDPESGENLTLPGGDSTAGAVLPIGIHAVGPQCAASAGAVRVQRQRAAAAAG